MAGSDQSANLGGMLSQIGGALGKGVDVSGLGANIVNMSRPDVDPTNLQQMMGLQNWQQKVGREDAARTTMAGVQQLQSQQKAAEKLGLQKAALGFKSSYMDALAKGNQPLAAKIKESAAKFSSETGVDVVAGLSQVDSQQRAQGAEQRALEQFQWSQATQKRAEEDRSYRGTWATLRNNPEGKALLIEEMNNKGLGGTVAALEATDRTLTTWNQSQADRAEKQVAVTPEDYSRATTLIANMAESGAGGEKLSGLLTAEIKAIQENPEISNRMKRQQVNAVVEKAYNYSVQQASASDAQARKLAGANVTDAQLKSPAEWMVTGIETQLQDLKPGFGDRAMSSFSDAASALGLEVGKGGPSAEEQQVFDAIDEGGKDFARRVAAYLTTYPQLEIQGAAKLAASVPTAVVSNTSSNKGGNSDEENTINYDKDGNRL